MTQKYQVLKIYVGTAIKIQFQQQSNLLHASVIFSIFQLISLG